MESIRVGALTVGFATDVMGVCPTEPYALVSSDDTWLTASGGVSAAILRVAGASVRDEMRAAVRHAGGRLPLATVTRTGGGATGAAAILHAVTLDFEGRRAARHELLASLILAVLDHAAAEGIPCVVLPMLATGAARAKPQEFADGFRRAIREHALAPSPLRRVVLARLDEVDPVWAHALGERRSVPRTWSDLAAECPAELAAALSDLGRVGLDKGVPVVLESLRAVVAAAGTSLRALAEQLDAWPAALRLKQAMSALADINADQAVHGVGAVAALRELHLVVDAGLARVDGFVDRFGSDGRALGAGLQPWHLARSAAVSAAILPGGLWGGMAKGVWRMASAALLDSSPERPDAGDSGDRPRPDTEPALRPPITPDVAGDTAPSRLADLVMAEGPPEDVRFQLEVLSDRKYKGSPRQQLTEFVINEGPSVVLQIISKRRRWQLAVERAGALPRLRDEEGAADRALLTCLGFRLPGQLMGPQELCRRLETLAALALQDPSSAADRVREGGAVAERLLKHLITYRAQVDFGADADALLQSRAWVSKTQRLQALGLGALLAVVSKLDLARGDDTKATLLPADVRRLSEIRNDYVHDRDYREWAPEEFFREALPLARHLCDGDPPLLPRLVRVLAHRVNEWGIHTFDLVDEHGVGVTAHLKVPVTVGDVFYFHATSNPKAVFPIIVPCPIA